MFLLIPNYSFAYDPDTNPDAAYLNHPQPHKVVDSECYTNCMVDGQPQMQCDNLCSHYEPST